MVCDDVFASDVYKLDDFVYFDPISNSPCNETNYWTEYNKNTTCYCFIVLNANDTSSSSTLKIMLDHNVGISNYANYKTVLKEKTSDWTGYDGTIDIIDEDTIYELLRLDKKPNLVNLNEQSVNGGNINYYFTINSLYQINGQYSYGFWSKDIYEDNQNYVYTITENGNNRLVLKTHTRGVRPVITVNKSLLTKSSDLTNISSLIENAKEYKYKASTQEYNGYVYNHLQGFTVANNKLIFHSVNSSDTSNGLISVYNGTNYTNLYQTDYRETGHGNDMTYNSQTNKILLVGPNSYSDIYQYNANTLSYEKNIQILI